MADNKSKNCEIFVFGSNLSGIHGKGAAYAARLQHGAIYGKGEGLQGNSYAIPTKDFNIKTLPIDTIAQHVKRFIQFAKDQPWMTFNVTRVGCGLAGYRDDQIAPLFRGAPDNCRFDPAWEPYVRTKGNTEE